MAARYSLPGKQWGYFPSASVGWRVSKEEWFKNKRNLYRRFEAKRASYGSLGNDNVNGFQYFDNYVLVSNGFVASQPGSGSSTIQPNVNLVKLANPNITWETARKARYRLKRHLPAQLYHRGYLLQAKKVEHPWLPVTHLCPVHRVS
jgi:hypothetical protein